MNPCFFLPGSWCSLHMPSGLSELCGWQKTLCQKNIWYLSRFSLPKSGRTVSNQEGMDSLLLRKGVVISISPIQDPCKHCPKSKLPSSAFARYRQHENWALIAFSQEALTLLQTEIRSLTGSPDFHPCIRRMGHYFSFKLLFYSFFFTCRFALFPRIIKAMTRFLASASVKLTVWITSVILSVGGNKEKPCKSPVQRKILSFLSLTEMEAR